MANRTNSSEYFWSYEYYWDYIDPIPVDGSKLKVNKYSIIIAFWVGLAAFVTFLFLVLLCMSCSGSTPANTTMNRNTRSGRSSLDSDCTHDNYRSQEHPGQMLVQGQSTCQQNALE